MSDSKVSQSRLAREYAVLAEIGRIISSSLNINEVYKPFAEKVGEIIKFDVISISMIDLDKNLDSIVYTQGLKVPGRSENDSIPADGTLSEEVARAGKSVMVGLARRDVVEERFPRLLPSFDAGNRSFLAIPLISNDKVIGILHIRSNTTNAYSSRDKFLAEQVGAQIAGAIANSQLYASVQRDAREREALILIGQIISASLDVDQVYDRFAEEVRSVVDFDHIAISLIDSDKGEMVIGYHRGFDIPERRQGDVVPLAGSLGEEVVKRQATVMLQGAAISDVARQFSSLAPILNAGIKSLLSTPLVSNNEVIGILNIGTGKSNAYTEWDRQFLERVGAQIAGAIANSQLYEEWKRVENELRDREEQQRKNANEDHFIAEVGRIIGSSLDINMVYERFGDLVREFIPFERLTVGTVDLNSYTASVAYLTGLDVPSRGIGIEFPISGTFTESIIQKRCGMIIQALNSEDEARILDEMPGLKASIDAGLRSILAVPLISNDQVIATLQFRSSDYNFYNQLHLDIAEKIGAQIAGAVANSQLYDQTVRVEDALRASEETQRRLAEENAVLAEIGRIIGSSLNIEEVYGSFAAEVKKLIPFDRITVNVVDAKSQTFRVPYSMGIGVANRSETDVLPLAGSVTEEVVGSRATLRYLPASNEDPIARFPGLSNGYEKGLRSFLSVPLISKGQAIGAFHIRSMQSNAYSEHHAALAESIGVQIAGAIANAALFDENVKIQKELNDLTKDLSRSNEEMSTEVQERERFEVALKAHASELARSNAELEQFAYVASHDLQEPLRKIQSFGDLLGKKAEALLDEQTRGYLYRMLNAAERMQKLIDGLLTFSRVTTMARPFAKVDMEEIAREVLSDLEARIVETSARVQVETIPTVEADPLQMRQLLQNIIGNALKFHRPEEPPVVIIHGDVVADVTLQRDNKLECQEFCRIFVDDNGIGFNEKYLDRIFTIFQRLQGRSQYEGTGIGLAICRKIVERHHGSITAKSSPDNGASFVITIPMVQN